MKVLEIIQLLTARRERRRAHLLQASAISQMQRIQIVTRTENGPMRSLADRGGQYFRAKYFSGIFHVA
jgi:hypothetical protein